MNPEMAIPFEVPNPGASMRVRPAGIFTFVVGWLCEGLL
jgi:hypothetical protein